MSGKRTATNCRRSGNLRSVTATDLLDVAEAHEELRRLGRDDVQRPQARDFNDRQIVGEAAFFTHIKLDTSEIADGAT